MNAQQELLNIKADSKYKNILYLLFTEGGTKILSLLSFVFIARGLSQESYGIVTLAFSVGSLFFVFFNFGLDFHLIRDIQYHIKTNNRTALHELTSTVATLKTCFLPIFLGIFTLLFLIMRWDRIYFPIMVLIFLYFYIMNFTQLILSYFRAFEKMKYEFATRTIQSILLLVITFFSVYFYKSPLLLATGYIIIASATLLGIFIFFVKKFGFIPHINRRIKKRETALIGKTKYLFLASICTSIFSGVDILILSKVGKITDVAIYKNAVIITLALFMIPTAVMQGFFPKLTQYTTDLSIFFQLVKKIIVILAPSGLLIAMLLFTIADPLINGLWGHAYSPSIPLFRVSLLAFIFATINHVFGYGMIALGRYKIFFLFTLAYTVLNVLLNIILIPKIGLLGGIIAMNITHFVAILLPLGYLYFLHHSEKMMEMQNT